jgi:hypothetical protein
MGLLSVVGISGTASVASSFGNLNDFLIGVALFSVGLIGYKESRQFDQEAEMGATNERYKFTTFGTGTLHGLAPDGLLFLAPALALPKVAAISHLGGIAVGTLLAMGFFTAGLKIISRRRQIRLKLLSGVASGIAMLFGATFLASALASYLGVSLALPAMWGRALA